MQTDSSPIVRLFVSSTFGDFKRERDLLQQKIFPELRELCRSYDAGFVAVDLRWGISKEDSANQQTMNICMEEIERCQASALKPNFMVLLGQRRGTQLLPASIDADVFERLIAKMPDDALREFVSYWYQRDSNAVPATMLLQPRTRSGTVDYSDRDQWMPVQRRLLTALRNAARKELPPDQRSPYELSATGQEIMLGALRADGAETHVRAFVRRIEGLPERFPRGSSEADFVDILEGTEDEADPAAREAQLELESQLRDRLGPDGIIEYQADWGSDGVRFCSGDDGFCDAVLAQYRPLIEAQLKALQTSPLADRQALAQRAFRAERVNNFVGRENELSAFRRTLVQRNSTTPVVVTGPPGCGKSAFVARALEEIEALLLGSVVVYRFLGATSGSTSTRTLIDSLLGELGPLDRDHAAANTLEEQRKLLDDKLSRATAEHPRFLVLDALDQMDRHSQDELTEWLPRQLPEHVHILVSVARVDGDGLADRIVEHFGADTLVIDLPAMTAADGETMLSGLLAMPPARRLTSGQRRAVLDAFVDNGSPLHLRLAAEEARRWHSFDKEVPALKRNIEDMVERQLSNLCKPTLYAHGPVLVARTVEWLAAARYGLAEDELLDLLSADEEVIAELEDRYRNALHQKRLPIEVWSRLRHDLEPYLTRTEVQGRSVLKFFHGLFNKVVRERPLSDKSPVIRHGQLADYFVRRNGGSHWHNIGARRADSRKMLELPWQLRHAGRIDELRVLLQSFDFCMAKCSLGAVDDLLEDLLMADAGESGSPEFQQWQRFIFSNAHVLRRGVPAGTAGRLLFAQSINSDAGSVSQQAAERYLSEGNVDWTYLRQVPKIAQTMAPFMTFDRPGHVVGTAHLPDDSLLAWYGDGSITRWNCRTGAKLWSREVHAGPVLGALKLDSDTYVSWARQDSHLHRWSARRGDPLARSSPAAGRLAWIEGVIRLDAHRLASWSIDNHVCLWDSQSLGLIARIKAPVPIKACLRLSDSALLLTPTGDHEVHRLSLGTACSFTRVEGCSDVGMLEDGRILVTLRGVLQLWNSSFETMLAECPATDVSVDDATLLSDGRIVLRGRRTDLVVWNPTDGGTVRLAGHDLPIRGYCDAGEGRLVTCSQDHTVRVWEIGTQRELFRLHHQNWVNGALKLDGKRLVTWGDGTELHLWHLPEIYFDGQFETSAARSVEGSLEFDPDRLVLWGGGDGLCFWNQSEQKCLGLPEPHEEAKGACAAPGTHLISWDYHAVQVRDQHTLARVAEFSSPEGYFFGALPVSNERVITWAERDPNLRLWCIGSASQLACLSMPSDVHGARHISGGRVLAWLGDSTLRIVSADGMEILESLPHGDEGAASMAHDKSITWAAELDPGRLISWSQGEGRLLVWSERRCRVQRVRSGLTSVVQLSGGWLSLKFRNHPSVLWHPASDREVPFAPEIDDWNTPPRIVPLESGAALAIGSRQAAVVHGLHDGAFSQPRTTQKIEIKQGGVIRVNLGNTCGGDQQAGSADSVEWHDRSLGRLLHAWPDGQFLVDANGPVCLRLYRGTQRANWA